MWGSQGLQGLGMGPFGLQSSYSDPKDGSGGTGSPKRLGLGGLGASGGLVSV